LSSIAQPLESHRKTVPIVVGVILVIAFAAAYAFALISFQQEGQYRAAPWLIGDETQANRLDLNTKILSVDPSKGEMAVRVEPVPQGTLTTDGGATAATNITVYTNGATGQVERVFEKGKTISPFDMVVNLEGQVTDYPFDSHTGVLAFWVSTQDQAGDAAAQDVPVVLQTTGNLQGFSLDIASDPESSESAPIEQIQISRSGTVLTTAIAEMAIMWGIAVAVILLTVVLVTRNRKLEAFTLYSGLLFGLFALRNSLPGTPPIGTLSDFLAFIWVEGIVAAAMIVGIFWVVLKPQPK
jgi:hypothetical protein